MHNLDFDGILLLAYLTKTRRYSYKTFARSMKFYKIEVHFENKKIIFLCSYKLLPLSLEKIATGFTALVKLSFPYSFSSLENLFYAGPLPGPTYWNSSNDYTNYTKERGKFFDFRQYSIEYCLNDVKITYSFIIVLSKLLEEFKINLRNIYSGPSLALKIFSKVFNKGNKINFSITGFYDKIARQAYYGGRCEVYGNPIAGDYIFHFDFEGMYAQCLSERFGYGKHVIKTNNFNVANPGFY